VIGRLRNQDGFTLIEVIAAMTVGLVLLGSTLTLLESSVKLNTGVVAKTDAMQRGRIAMDTITQQLRSQVCFDMETSAIVAGSDEDHVTFYSDFTAEDDPPVKRTITIDGRGIVSDRFDAPSPLPEEFTPESYEDFPDASSLVLENAALLLDPDTGETVPFLKYYAYEENDGLLTATDELDPPLNDAEAARAARVEITYVSRPTGASDGKKNVTLNDEIMARHSDPNLAVPDPRCV
jgi:prepilin-type N-terminal cleavage/methylation domain-containing protein